MFLIVYPLLLFSVIGAVWAIIALVSKRRKTPFKYLAGWVIMATGGLLFLSTVFAVWGEGVEESAAIILRGLVLGLLAVWWGRSWVAHNPKRLIVTPPVERCMSELEKEVCAQRYKDEKAKRGGERRKTSKVVAIVVLIALLGISLSSSFIGGG